MARRCPQPSASARPCNIATDPDLALSPVHDELFLKTKKIKKNSPRPTKTTTTTMATTTGKAQTETETETETKYTNSKKKRTKIRRRRRRKTRRTTTTRLTGRRTGKTRRTRRRLQTSASASHSPDASSISLLNGRLKDAKYPCVRGNDRAVTFHLSWSNDQTNVWDSQPAS